MLTLILGLSLLVSVLWNGLLLIKWGEQVRCSRVYQRLWERAVEDRDRSMKQRRPINVEHE